jgi:hypothetical protein
MTGVMYVDPRGKCWWPSLPPGLVSQRLAAERDRCASILARAMPPERVSREIIAAPARLYSIAETPRETVLTENGPRVQRSAGPGRDRVRVGDAFDVMEEQARRAHAKRTKGLEREGKPIFPFQPPFSVGQVEIGREYAALVERCDGAGVKCSSLETIGGGSGDPDAREAAIFHDFQRLRVLRRRIGDGLAREIRRHRPGERRSAIRVRALVDDVCLSGLTLDQVFARYGWANVNMNMRADLRSALCGALDRMRGFGLVQPLHAA